MTVRSARIQQVIVGDDWSLAHQIVKPSALDANATLVPVELQAGDVATAFYSAEPIEGVEQADVSVVATPVGAYPTSRIAVAVTPVNSAKVRINEAQTVRIEIVRTGTLKKESYYLFQEIDVYARGFPESADAGDLILP